MTLPGFTSRWTTPARCTYASTPATVAPSLAAPAGLIGPLRSTSTSVGPSTSSIARYIRSPIVPASSRRTRPGCSSRSRAPASWTRRRGGRRIVGTDDLERDLASAEQVVGAVHVRHPAAPEDTVQPVAMGEHLIEGEVDRSHRSNPPAPFSGEWCVASVTTGALALVGADGLMVPSGNLPHSCRAGFRQHGTSRCARVGGCARPIAGAVGSSYIRGDAEEIHGCDERPRAGPGAHPR